MTSPSAFLYRYTPGSVGMVRIFWRRSIARGMLHSIRWRSPKAVHHPEETLCQNRGPMNRKLTIRVGDDLHCWLKGTSRLVGVPVSRIVLDLLEKARVQQGKQRFLRHAGAISGLPADRSSRKGFSRE